MQAKKRYLLVLLSCAFLAYCYFGGYRLKSEGRALMSPAHAGHWWPLGLPSAAWWPWGPQTAPDETLPSYLDELLEKDMAFSTHLRRSDSDSRGTNKESWRPKKRARACRMETCFDFSRCSGDDFKVYVYPPDDGGDEGGALGAYGGAAEEEEEAPVNDHPMNALVEGGEGEDDGAREEEGHREEEGPHGGGAGANGGPGEAPAGRSLGSMARQRRRRRARRGRGPQFASYPPPSATYRKILDSIVESRYFTSDPSRACLFVLALDTLDRDSLSPDFARDVPGRLARLPLWNNGRNHLVFNLYSGTWPHYLEPSEGPGGGGLGFDPGEAILARASASEGSLRPGFDVSLPLFHRSHPWRGGDAPVNDRLFPVSKKFLLAFKGKRYVHGIGSDARNALHHLHNGRDVVLVTTCRHGKSWREMKDERCDEDNAEYDRWDYEALLQNSTFCLVPRGRRLGSFRFLESLRAGCIPVLLANAWTLPFASVIEWRSAAVWADERLLLQVPEMVRSIPPSKVFAMRQQTQLLWDRYFSSVEKIVFTTLEIIRERIPSQPSRDGLVWNSSPGALLALPQFSDTWRHYPFSLGVGFPTGFPGTIEVGLEDVQREERFTAVVYTQQASLLASPSSPTAQPLHRLLRNVARSNFVARIVIICSGEKCGSRLQPRWPQLPSTVPINVLQAEGGGPLGGGAVAGAGVNGGGISRRFRPHALIQTSAILSLDEDCLLTTDEVDFAFSVWRAFPERIVGYPARSHFWDDAKGSWGYTSKWTNEYSIVLTGAAFYHRYYNFLYTRWLSPLLLKTVEQSHNCEDILMNFLVAHVTRRPPIKVTQRKQYKEQPPGGARSPWNDPDHFVQRQTCLNTFAAVFGYMPLLRSSMRLDPVLFKDPVSNLRKKYRQIELVGS
ncbi:exostosin-1 [Ischnura elegans]|uniref:exostosin-1 n=1 Tax=Ischnura elegans TaxID=197161 RepID=UPI001ED868AA|nr:exostosin-1 [Ischnura elegans]